MLQNELFLEQLGGDPEFAEYLRANPRVAAQLGIPLHQLPAAGMRGAPLTPIEALHTQRRAAAGAPHVAPLSARGSRSGSGSGAALGAPASPAAGAGVGTGAGSGSGGAADWSSAVQSMGSDMRRRFDLISARFRRSNNGGVAAGAGGAGAARPAATSSTRGFMSSLFDGRGAYSALPVHTSSDLRDDDDAAGGVGGDERPVGSAGSLNGSGAGRASPPPSGMRGDRVRQMSTKSPLVGSRSGASGPEMVELELGSGPRSATTFDVEEDEDESESASLKRRV
jgi:hypothetical protein